MERPTRKIGLPLQRTVLALLLAGAACAGGGGGAGGVPPEPGAVTAPASTEQTLTDLFNLTALYQRMGRFAGDNPLPFVGSAASFAGRGDSTVVLLALSLDNRSLSFQRTSRDFVARYRVEINLQAEGAAPIRYAREEVVSVATYPETQRADESVVFQQGFLLQPGKYQLSVLLRDPLSSTASKAEMGLTVPAFGPGSFTAPILAYDASARANLWDEPRVLLNPRGTVAHGGDSLAVLIEVYELPGPVKLPFQMRDEQDQVLFQDSLAFEGGRAVEAKRIKLSPETPSLGRMTITVGPTGQAKQTVALVSFSRAWVVTNYDNLLNLLRYYGHDSDLDLLRKAAPADRARLWREFWVNTDPNPLTPENEALEQYFTRVAFANERFRDEGAGQGWRSERGEVLITIGPPDQEVESPPGSDVRVIQWVYNEYRAVLTFTGQQGFTRLRLTPTSRAEFQRIRALVRQREGRQP
jgi:GWxTD domain-containing protein